MSKKIVRLTEDVEDFEGNSANITVGKVIIRQLQNMPLAENPQVGATQGDLDKALRCRALVRRLQKAMQQTPPDDRLEKVSETDYTVIDEAIKRNPIGFPRALMTQVIEAYRGISYDESDDRDDRDESSGESLPEDGPPKLEAVG